MTTDNNIKNYWEKRLNENYGLHGTGYIGLGKKFNYWMYNVRKKVFLKKLTKLNLDTKNMDVLDIGSGSGFYISLWIDHGVKSIMGSDITSVSVKNLKKMYPKNDFLEMDISDDVIPITKKFHIISAFDMLFHIVDDDKYSKAIKNIFDMLHPGGFFIFSENFIHTDSLHNQYQTTRSINDITRVIKNSGFQILERSPMFYFMNTPVDSQDYFLNKSWQLIKKLVSKGEKYGELVGGMLFPVEILMVSIKKESPSTEMMICKKPY